MAEVAESNLVPKIFAQVAKFRHLLVPMAFLSLVIVLVIPMPTPMMDILLASNLALAAVILLTTIYMSRPLDFSVFPALLLGTTLFRLVLNVATTRLILTADADSPEAAALVAGHVVNAFGNFVAGDSVIVGTVIFIILIVVQFVVITKGATRMSEVAARFTLDAMPGKQMAIDADLSAGLIDEAAARARRESIMREADFYGAMDGASKFVRGDAVAGIIITLVNVLGGFAIGALERGWGITDSLKVFTRLTIGDGLVSQVPAFIIAIAAGLIVARTGGKETIGDEIPKQLTSQPLALYLIGAFLALLSFTPLPTIPLLSAALILGVIAFSHQYSAKLNKKSEESKARMDAAAMPPTQQPVEELLPVDQLELEIGYGLVQLVDASRGGDLLNRISMIRRQLASEMGIVVPPVRIRDNMQLDPNAYRVKLRGAVIGDGRVYPHLLMAMDSGLASGRIDGVAGKEPAFGLEATWIQPELKSRAENMNYTVVDSTSVMATHVTELVKSHADELLTRQEVSRLIDQVKKDSPKLVDDVIGGLVKMGDVQKVLQNLLHERVPVKDLPTILETLGDWATHTKDVAVLTEYVRNALRRTISAQYSELDEQGIHRLYCITIDPTVEDTLNGYIDRSAAGTTVSVPSSLANRLVNIVSTTAEKLITAGHQLVILCSPTVRSPLRQILEPHLPSVAVLAYNEVVRGLDVESMGLVQWRKEDAMVLGASAA